MLMTLIRIIIIAIKAAIIIIIITAAIIMTLILRKGTRNTRLDKIPIRWGGDDVDDEDDLVIEEGGKDGEVGQDADDNDDGVADDKG